MLRLANLSPKVSRIKSASSCAPNPAYQEPGRDRLFPTFSTFPEAKRTCNMHNISTAERWRHNSCHLKVPKGERTKVAA